MNGPLSSLKVVEFTGLGPGPVAGQLLADLGADVIAIDRKSGAVDKADINRRGKRSIALNLKSEEGIATAKRLASSADVVIEGFRPGVMEKLGLGPDDLSDQVVYGRVTGWGQNGPLAHTAGHDINYLALTGALHAIGTRDSGPIPPLNLVADFAGGSMMLVFGILSAVIARGQTGKGQVVDAAMVDGVPALMGLIHMLMAKGMWIDGKRQSNMLDGGLACYRTYETSDNGHMSVGPLEPQFFAILAEKTGLNAELAGQYMNPKVQPDLHRELEGIFKTKTRAEWSEIFDGTDACVAPVLTMKEAADHPHMKDREVFFEADGIFQSAPAPRFSDTKTQRPATPDAPGSHSVEILSELGLDHAEIEHLRANGALS